MIRVLGLVKPNLNSPTYTPSSGRVSFTILGPISFIAKEIQWKILTRELIKKSNKKNLTSFAFITLK